MPSTVMADVPDVIHNALIAGSFAVFLIFSPHFVLDMNGHRFSSLLTILIFAFSATCAKNIELRLPDVKNSVSSGTISLSGKSGRKRAFASDKKLKDTIAKLTRQMRKAAEDLEFEQAAKIRDEIKRLENSALSLSGL